MDFRGPFVRPSGIVQPAPEVRSEAILDDTRLIFFYYNRFFNPNRTIGYAKFGVGARQRQKYPRMAGMIDDDQSDSEQLQ